MGARPMEDADREAMRAMSTSAKEMLDHESIPDQLRATSRADFISLLARFEALADHGGTWLSCTPPVDEWVAVIVEAGPRIASQFEDGDWRTPTGQKLTTILGWTRLPCMETNRVR